MWVSPGVPGRTATELLAKYAGGDPPRPPLPLRGALRPPHHPVPTHITRASIVCGACQIHVAGRGCATLQHYHITASAHDSAITVRTPPTTTHNQMRAVQAAHVHAGTQTEGGPRARCATRLVTALVAASVCNTATRMTHEDNTQHVEPWMMFRGSQDLHTSHGAAAPRSTCCTSLRAVL